MKKLDFYYIDLKYIRDLSRKDDNVMSISPQRGKQNRPFVGVVVMTNERKYCIPLTSPKDKFKNRKSQVDFIKVYDLVTKTPEKSRNLVRRSSDFIKLEKIADEYEQKEIKND
jgi:protein AbiQ